MPTIRIPLLPTNRPWFDPRTGIPTAEFSRVIHDLVRRTGGQANDFVATALETAQTAGATATASAAGLTVPTPGGSVELNPANPLSSESQGGGLAAIFIAGHTRTGAAAAIVAGSISGVSEGSTYYVYYSDPTNAGGAVTFEYSASAGDVGSKRLIGVIAIPYTPKTSGVDQEIGI